ncbi:SNF2-related protein [Streptococcus pluranimalium]|uniref:DEAD/DEAH box helicase n=1 Tax=Streptococcus pluranimalium TaxID=82348 RepID=A0A2L0D5A3_9STRE|nr:DEAD/DEAH box helicase [Streptococcus pluranimalium]AUW96761.1 DEAD/DEAH box helicase [Streptococcus pluranimalium]
MTYKPHDYQTYATEFIKSHSTACLMLEMGLGKTVITLTALWDLILDSFEVRRVLIIAPLRVAEHTWQEELKKWEHLSGLTLSVVVGSDKERRAALRKPAFLYTLNRENVVWLIDNKLFDFDMVIIDELSSFKSYQSKRFKALRRVQASTKRMVGLTGTPGNLMDLFSEIGILDGGKRLGRFITGFRDQYFLPDKRNGQVVFSYKPKEGAEDAIYDRISDMTISMKALDYLQMPERIDHEVLVEMNLKEKELYQTFKQELVVSLKDQVIDAINSASLSNKLLQLANGSVYGEEGAVLPFHDKKLEILEEMVEAMQGKPLLVAYWFKHDLKRLKERFKEARTISSSQAITDWNNGKISIGLIHPASSGHGLNLQAGGSTICWFGLTWSLELYQQLNARLWRQGQKETVIIHHLITKGTIDEEVMKRLKTKTITQDHIIEAVRVSLKGG